MFARAAGGWLLLLVLAILNGTLRTAVLSPRFGEHTGHVLSSILLSLLIFGATWILLPWAGPHSIAEAWRIGALWLAMTIAFELLGGHFLFGAPWSRLAADYNLAAGRIWIVVLAATLCSPPAVFHAR